MGDVFLQWEYQGWILTTGPVAQDKWHMDSGLWKFASNNPGGNWNIEYFICIFICGIPSNFWLLRLLMYGAQQATAEKLLTSVSEYI